jgi:hypothetical protein
LGFGEVFDDGEAEAIAFLAASRAGAEAGVFAEKQGPLGEGNAGAGVVDFGPEAVFGEAFGQFLEEHPEETRAILGKITLAMKARKAALRGGISAATPSTGRIFASGTAPAPTPHTTPVRLLRPSGTFT